MLGDADIPQEQWIAGLLLAAPQGVPEDDPVAQMAWQRSLAYLACTCRKLRRILASPAAEPLFAEAAIVPHWRWKSWEPFGKRSCALLAQWLHSRAILLTELHMDCTMISSGVLSSLLSDALRLRVLTLTESGLSAASAQTLSDVFAVRLPSLRHLACDGTHMPFAAMPPLLTYLYLHLSRHGLMQPEQQSFCAALAKLRHLQELRIHLTGHDPFGMVRLVPYTSQTPGLAGLRLCQKLLSAFAACPASQLQEIHISQHLDQAMCRRVCLSPGEPTLLHLPTAELTCAAVDQLPRLALTALCLVKLELGLEGEDSPDWHAYMCALWYGDDSYELYVRSGADPFILVSSEVRVSRAYGSGGMTRTAAIHEDACCSYYRPNWACNTLFQATPQHL